MFWWLNSKRKIVGQEQKSHQINPEHCVDRSESCESPVKTSQSLPYQSAGFFFQLWLKQGTSCPIGKDIQFAEIVITSNAYSAQNCTKPWHLTCEAAQELAALDNHQIGAAWLLKSHSNRSGSRRCSLGKEVAAITNSRAVHLGKHCRTSIEQQICHANRWRLKLQDCRSVSPGPVPGR